MVAAGGRAGCPDLRHPSGGRAVGDSSTVTAQGVAVGVAAAEGAGPADRKHRVLQAYLCSYPERLWETWYLWSKSSGDGKVKVLGRRPVAGRVSLFSRAVVRIAPHL